VNLGPGKNNENIETLDIFVISKKGFDMWIERDINFKDKSIKIDEL
jgi:hypothetical protein